MVLGCAGWAWGREWGRFYGSILTDRADAVAPYGPFGESWGRNRVAAERMFARSKASVKIR